MRDLEVKTIESPAKINVLIADDHPVVREGMASIIDSIPGFQCVAQAPGAESAIEAWAEHSPDLGVFDLRMPDGDAVSAITRIHKFAPRARILVVSSFDGDEEVFRVMQAGARGYLLKDSEPDLIKTALTTIHAGQRYLPSRLAMKLAERISTSDLSNREIEVLTLAATGLKNADIADKLFVSQSTVKFHLNNTYSKLNVSNRTAAISTAMKRGVISVD